CRASALDRTCTKYDSKYEFIQNGCPTDDTVEYGYSVSSEKRFTLSAFSFLHYASNDQVMIKCKMFACKQGKSNSACAKLQALRNSCGQRGRRSTKIEVDADDVQFEAFLPLRFRH
ncbi:zona pellucida domain-containing protein, partial [Salmonella sp. s51090]|uniref:zona pellucida domain-containing protein n=1 Tax=Salmonella sp. s51090 TaxID=3159651 RepID=UPI0039805777